MLRMIASLSTCRAIRGKYSHTWMPGTLVLIGRNGPPVGRPGFMSKVSMWLGPPAIHKRMQRLPCRWASWAMVCELNRLPQFVRAPPAAVPTIPLSIDASAEVILDRVKLVHDNSSMKRDTLSKTPGIQYVAKTYTFSSRTSSLA